MNPTSTVIVLAAVVAALALGREILIPLALSVLLSFALAPIVVRLRRIGLPRIPAVLMAVMVVGIVAAAAGVVVAGQLVSLADNFGRYEQNLREKIQAARTMFPTGGPLARATEAIQDLNREIDEATRPAPPAPGSVDGTGDQRPLPVEVHERPPTAMETVRAAIGPLIDPLVSTGMIVVFVIFMLIERTELRDRLTRLIDQKDLSRASRIVDDAASRVSRYLLMQLLVATAHGIPYGLGLWAIGVPNPVLWGFLAAVLRFVPFLGPAIAAACPLLLAIAADPGWTMVWQTALLILVLELITNNVLEPWLYGSTTGLSPIAVLAAAVFWTTLWGPIGLLLSVPLTVCLVVLGRHVPGLGLLEVLLGDQPALGDPDRVYQRMLAGDRFEALDLAERLEARQGFQRLADDILLPVLRLAERDRERQTLDVAGQKRVAAIMDEIGADLVDLDPHGFDEPPTDGATEVRPRALCVGGRHELDLASAGVLARALEQAGVDVKAVPASALRPIRRTTPPAEQPQLVFVAYLSPPTPMHEHRIERRARMLLGADFPVVACRWDGGTPGEEGGKRETVSSVADALRAARAHLALPPPAETAPADLPEAVPATG